MPLCSSHHYKVGIWSHCKGTAPFEFHWCVSLKLTEARPHRMFLLCVCVSLMMKFSSGEKIKMPSKKKKKEFEQGWLEQISLWSSFHPLCLCCQKQNLKKKKPGAQVRVHAVAHTCKCNYDDKDFPVSHREIHQNDDMHCSVQAFRLIMERLPRRPWIEPGSTTGWGALRAKEKLGLMWYFWKGCFIITGCRVMS